MLSGFVVIGVALATVLALVIAAQRLPSHGRGCDCGECERWHGERRFP